MTRPEAIAKIRTLIDEHFDRVLREQADQITPDDGCYEMFAQAVDLARYRADVLARCLEFLDEVPMTGSEAYYAKVTAELDRRMGVAFDNVMTHLVTVGASDAVIAESIAYFREYAASQRDELLEQTRSLCRRADNVGLNWDEINGGETDGRE